mmetsp:Transcript_88515/g.249449  ORF Transcript_88515/g.249449 Transcript_88515/m.249449 type:complete len:217 (+) Transcript_88515:1700-2350(+)
MTSMSLRLVRGELSLPARTSKEHAVRGAMAADVAPAERRRARGGGRVQGASRLPRFRHAQGACKRLLQHLRFSGRSFSHSLASAPPREEADRLAGVFDVRRAQGYEPVAEDLVANRLHRAGLWPLGNDEVEDGQMPEGQVRECRVAIVRQDKVRVAEGRSTPGVRPPGVDHSVALDAVISAVEQRDRARARAMRVLASPRVPRIAHIVERKDDVAA